MNKKLFVFVVALLTSILCAQEVPLAITVHVQNMGDLYGTENHWIGTKGQCLRLELFNIRKVLKNQFTISYFAHLEGIGDVPWVEEGNDVGTRGQGRRLEGFAIRLFGPDAQNYSVSYAAHLEGIGDTGLFSDGDFCGTRGQSRRVEAIFVKITKK